MEQPLESTPNPPACCRRQRIAGFSFMEILIVMAIIGILAGLGLVVMQIWRQKGPVFRTHERINRVATLIGSWKTKFERLPPSDPARIAGTAGPGLNQVKLTKLPNKVNVGIESVVLCLYWPSFGEDPQLGDDVLGNTDEDELSKPATMQGKALYEVLDDWGNPLVYFVNTDYAKADADPPTYWNAKGEEFNPRPWKYEDASRGFAEALGFQLFSCGPDGIPNTEDDIKSW